MERELTRLRKLIPWLAEADICGLQQTLRDLDGAYSKFFSGVAGYPNPRHLGDARYRVCGKASFAVSDDWVRLPKLGWVRFEKSRELPRGGRIMNVSVSREGGRWFVSFCVQHDGPVALTAPAGEAVGLDLGVTQSVTFSDATPPFQMPVPNTREQRFLKRLSRQVSRKVKGSARRAKAVGRLARCKLYHARRVYDAAHKLTTHLATTRSEIHMEDLKLRNMTASAAGTVADPGTNVRQKSGLNRSLLAQAHGKTARLLAYKCERSGTRLILKNPAHTSQECAECHHISPENRPSQAVFRCVKCGHTDNADHNAARVVLSRPTDGQAVAAHRGKRKSSRKSRRPDEVRTQRKSCCPQYGSSRITVKAVAA